MKRPRPVHKPDKAIATLTIHGAPEMEYLERAEIAEWLHHCADSLVNDGAEYSTTFTARYMERAKNNG